MLFPPHVQFRVVNVHVSGSKVRVLMETSVFPSVWESIKRKDLEGFKRWAKENPDRVDTKICEFSLVNAVAKHWLASADIADVGSAVEALQVCFENHADINEVDKETGSTPLMHVVDAAVGAEDGAWKEEVLRLRNLLLSSGGNPYLTRPRVGGGHEPSPAEKMPDINEVAESGRLRPSGAAS